MNRLKAIAAARDKELQPVLPAETPALPPAE
jgi:hypothetical protein